MAKRTGEKYEAIIDAAIRVIAENGYHNAQVSKIAREAKVADGTIYLYFENKDDMLISLFNEKMGAFIKTVREAIARVDSAPDQLRELMRLHLRTWKTIRRWRSSPDRTAAIQPEGAQGRLRKP